MNPPSLTLTVTAADGLLRIALDGALVDGTTAALRSWMHRHVPVTAGLLVLDLHGLREVDAVGLGALLAAHRRLGPAGQVQVAGATPAVARALRQSGMGRLLPAA